VKNPLRKKYIEVVLKIFDGNNAIYERL